MKLALKLFVVMMASASPAAAWDGTDLESRSAVEIGKGNLVRTGQNIEIYDAESGEYRDVTVEACKAPALAWKSKFTTTTVASLERSR